MTSIIGRLITLASAVRLRAGLVTALRYLFIDIETAAAFVITGISSSIVLESNSASLVAVYPDSEAIIVAFDDLCR